MVEKQQQHTAALARTLETVASFTKTSEKKSDRKKQNNNTLKRNKSKNSTETLWEEEKDKKTDWWKSKWTLTSKTKIRNQIKLND